MTPQTLSQKSRERVQWDGGKTEPETVPVEDLLWEKEIGGTSKIRSWSRRWKPSKKGGEVTGREGASCKGGDYADIGETCNRAKEKGSSSEYGQPNENVKEQEKDAREKKQKDSK